MFSALCVLIFLTCYMIGFIGFFAALLCLIVGTQHYNEVLMALGSLFIVYLILSDFVFLYLFKVKPARFDSRYELIFKNFEFRYRARNIKVFSSRYSPLFFRLGMWKNNYFLINERLFDKFTIEEVRAYFDCELGYTRTFGSYVEMICQKIYLLTIYPFELALDFIASKSVSMFLVAPPKYIYKVLISYCRKSYRYNGKFVSILPQAIFKVKMIFREREKIKVFNFSEESLDSYLPKNNHDEVNTLGA